MTWYGLLYFGLGLAAGIGITCHYVSRIMQRREQSFMIAAAGAIKQLAAERSIIMHKRCPECGGVMLSTTAPFVAPGSQN
jgi:hypothetical protein